MVSILTFVLGLAVGIAISYWKEHQFNLRLQEILTSLFNQNNNQISLSLISRIRREVIQLQELLGKQQEQLETKQELLNQIPLGYLQVDQENQLIWCNQKAQEMLKIRDWMGKPRLLLELVRSYELDRLIESTRHSQEHHSQTWELYTTDAQDSVKGVNLKAYTVPLLAGEVGVFIEDVQSITKAMKLTEQTISDLTHELRTPLTSIALVAETLGKRLENPEKGWVEKMYQETQRLIELVEEWLAINEITENPTQHLTYQTIIVQDLIHKSWLILEPLAIQKNLELEEQIPENLSIEGDRSRMLQVFINLFDTAIRHSSDNNKIQVIIEKIESNLEINVIDSGSGFAPGDLPYIFERIYKSDRSRARNSNSQGSGLGLSIVKQIIVAHGGEVEACNHPQTGGAWLKLTLPQKQFL